MIALWRFRTILLSLTVLVFMSGCRKAEAPRAYNRDLGTDETILLPVTSPWKEAQLKDGRADWQPFRKPGAEEAVVEETADDSAAGDAEETEADIRAMIAEYNELIGEATADELIEFYVSDQREALKPVIESALASNEKLGQVTAALEEQMPDAGDRVADAAQSVRTQAGIALAIESITVVGENEVAAKLAGGPVAGCTFRLLDDVWYIALEGAPEFAEIKQSTGALARTCESWLASLESGEATAETVLSQMAEPAPEAEEEPAEAPDEAEGEDEELTEEEEVEDDEGEEKED
jgi:hypothetical protein